MLRNTWRKKHKSLIASPLTQLRAALHERRAQMLRMRDASKALLRKKSLPHSRHITPLKPALNLIGKSVCFGPLVGGAIYNWAIFPIPISYALGAPSAFISGLLLLLWLRYESPNSAWRGKGASALLGVAISFVACVLAYLLSPTSMKELFWFVVPHAIFASAVLTPFFARNYREQVAAMRFDPVADAKSFSERCPSVA
jgi:hypothetical protein